MKFKLLFFALVILSLWSCQNDGDTGPKSYPPIEGEIISIFDDVIGSWETQSMTVYINGKDGTALNDTMIANRDNFLEMTGVKTARGHYYEDGSYRDEYVGANDSLLAATSGLWGFVADTLVVTQADTPITYKYLVSFPDEQTMEFKGMLDWDADGERDDLMTGISKRIEAVPQETAE